MKAPDQSPTTTRILKDLCRGVFRELPKALAGDEEPLHQMRVAARRLRVALPFVALKPQGKRVRRALTLLRGLVREAGSSRDLDVCCSLLEEHLRKQEPLASPAKALLKRVRSARNRSRGRMAEVLLDLDISGLRRRLRGCVERQGEGLFTVLQRLRQEREVRGGALIRSFEALGDRYDPTALHELRTGCRRLRYALETADRLKGFSSKAPGVLKDLQGELGRIHDDYVIAQWLMELGARAGERGEVELEIEVARQEAFFLESGRKKHREFLASDPRGRLRSALGRVDTPHFLQPFLGTPRIDR